MPKRYPTCVRRLSALALLAAAALPALAAERTCIQLRIERETWVSGRAGEMQLAPAERVSAGEQVLHTVIATNTCRRTLENVQLDVPIPRHMVYVPDSAIAPAAQVQFSVDGGFRYASADELQVTLPDGTRRTATPREYTHIRWILSKPLPADAQVLARFRAVVE